TAVPRGKRIFPSRGSGTKPDSPPSIAARPSTRTTPSRVIPASIVERRRPLLAEALGLVVVDPELGLLLHQEIGDPLERRLRLLGAGVHRRDPAVVPVVLEVRGVTTEQDPARLGQMHEQGLMPGCVAGSRDDGNAAVAEDVEVAVELPDGPPPLEGGPLARGERPVAL